MENNKLIFDIQRFVVTTLYSYGGKLYTTYDSENKTAPTGEVTLTPNETTTLTLGAGKTFTWASADGYAIQKLKLESSQYVPDGAAGSDITSITNNGTLTVKANIDGSVSGTGSIIMATADVTITKYAGTGNASQVSNGTIAEVTSVGGTIALSGGTITKVETATTINMTGGQITNAVKAATVNVSGSVTQTLTASDTSIFNVKSGANITTLVNNGTGTVDVQSGTVATLTVTDGTTTVKGGTVNSSTVASDKTLTVSGGKVEDASGQGTVEVTGGTVTVANGKTLANLTNNGGTATINGTVTNLTAGAGTTELKSGEVTDMKSGTLKMSGGEVKTLTAGIINATGGKIGSTAAAGGTINVASGSVTAITTTGAAVNVSGGSVETLTNTSGTVKITGSGAITTKLTTSTGNTTINTSGTIAEVDGTGSLTLTKGTIAKASATGTDSKMTGGTITTMSAGKIDVTGGTISDMSGGNVTVINSTANVTSIKSTSGTVQISNGTVQTLETANSTVANTAISGGTISKELKGSGSFTISGGTVAKASATGTGSTMTGGTITSLTAGTVAMSGGTISGATGGTINVTTGTPIAITAGSGAIVAVSGGTVGTLTSNGATTTISGSGKVTELKGSGAITFSGGTIDTYSGSGTITATGNSGTISSLKSGTVNVQSTSSGVTITNDGGTVKLNTAGKVAASVTQNSGKTEISNATASCTKLEQNGGTVTVSAGSVGSLTANGGTTTISGTGAVMALTASNGTGTTISSSGTIAELDGNGTVTMSGTGTITTYSGTGTVNMSKGTIGDITGTGTVNVTGGTEVQNTSGKVYVNSGTLSTLVVKAAGGTNEVKGGTVSSATVIAGTLKVSAGRATINAESGGTVEVTGGTVDVKHASTDFTLSNLKVDGGTVTVGSNATVSAASGSGTIVLNGGTISGYTGSGTITMNNASSSLEGFASGTVNVSNGTSVGATGGTVNVTGGTLTTLTASSSAQVNISGGIVTNGKITDTTANVKGGTLNITETSTGTINVSSGTLNLNTAVATTTVSQTGGTVNIGGGTAQTMESSGGTLNISGDFIGTKLTLSGSTAVNITGGTLAEVDGSGAIKTFSAGTITKYSGSGTFTTTGDATISEISGGNITYNSVNNITTISGGTVTVKEASVGTVTGGTVTMSGGNISTAINGANATVNFNSSGSITTLTNGTLNMTAGTLSGASGGTINITDSKADVSAVTSAGATLNMSNGKLGTLTATSGTFNISGGTITTATGTIGNFSGGTITTFSGTSLTAKGSAKIGTVITGTVTASGETSIGTISGGSVDYSGQTTTLTNTGGELTVNGGSVTTVNGNSGGANGMSTTISAGTVGTFNANGAKNGENITNIISDSANVTTLNANNAVSVTGGTVTNASGSGAITVTGGTVNVTGDTTSIENATGSTGTVVVKSGNVGTLTATVSGTATNTVVEGGTVNTLAGAGTATIKGGTVNTISGASTITMSGGTVNAVTAAATINISGGTIAGMTAGTATTQANASIDSITAGSSATVNVSNAGTVKELVTSGATVTVNNAGAVVELASGSGDISLTAGTIKEYTGTGTIKLTGNLSKTEYDSKTGLFKIKTDATEISCALDKVANVKDSSGSNAIAGVSQYYTYDATSKTVTLLASAAGQTFTVADTGTAPLIPKDVTKIDATAVASGSTIFTLSGSTADLTVEGGAGNLELNAESKAGTLTVNGGSGKVTVTGNATALTVNGGSGAVDITGGAGAVTVSGGTGNVKVTASTGAKTLVEKKTGGTVTMNGGSSGSGKITINAGDGMGNITVSEGAATSAVTVNAAANTKSHVISVTGSTGTSSNEIQITAGAGTTAIEANTGSNTGGITVTGTGSAATINVTNASSAAGDVSVIAGTGNVTVNGNASNAATGDITVTGPSTTASNTITVNAGKQTGAISVTAGSTSGKITVNGANVGTGTITVTGNTGDIDITVNKTTAGDITLTSASNTSQTVTFSADAAASTKVKYSGGHLVVTGANAADSNITIATGSYNTLKKSVINSDGTMTLYFDSEGKHTITIPNSQTAENQIAVKSGEDDNTAITGFNHVYAYDGDTNKITLAPGFNETTFVATTNYPETTQIIDASQVTAAITSLTVGANVTSLILPEDTTRTDTVTLPATSSVALDIKNADANDVIFFNGKTVESTSNDTNTKVNTLTVNFTDNSSVTFSRDVKKIYTDNSGTTGVSNVSTKYDYSKNDNQITMVPSSGTVELDGTASTGDLVSLSSSGTIDASKITGTLKFIGTAISNLKTLVMATNTVCTDNTLAASTLDFGTSGDVNAFSTSGTTSARIVTISTSGKKTATFAYAGGTSYNIKDKTNSGEAKAISTCYDYASDGTVTIGTFYTAAVAADGYPSNVKTINITDSAYDGTTAINVPTTTNSSGITVNLATPATSNGVLVTNNNTVETVNINGTGTWVIQNSNLNDSYKINSGLTVKATSIIASTSSPATAGDYLVEFTNGGKVYFNGKAIDGTDATTDKSMAYVASAISGSSNSWAISPYYTYDASSKTLTVLQQYDSTGTAIDFELDLSKLSSSGIETITATGVSKNLTIKGAIPSTVTALTLGTGDTTIVTGGGSNTTSDPLIVTLGTSGTLTWNGYLANQIVKLPTDYTTANTAKITQSTNQTGFKGFDITANKTTPAELNFSVTGSNLSTVHVRASDGTEDLKGISKYYNYDEKTDSTNPLMTIVQKPTGVTIGGSSSSSVGYPTGQVTAISDTLESVLDLTGQSNTPNVTLGSGKVTVFGHTTNTIYGGAGAVSIVGGTDVDSIALGAGGGTVRGNGGADLIDGSAASVASYIEGGADADKVTIAAGGGTVVGGDGADEIVADTITSGKTAIINGGAGADNITVGSAGAKVTIVGGEGADDITYKGGFVTVTSGGGSDIPVIKMGDASRDSLDGNSSAKTAYDTKTGLITVTFDSTNAISFPTNYYLKNAAGDATINNVSQFYAYDGAKNSITLYNYTDANVKLIGQNDGASDVTSASPYTGVFSTSVTLISAANYTKELSLITAASQTASIVLGKGGSNVTLGNGGGTVKGGTGADKIQFGGGTAYLDGLSSTGIFDSVIADIDASKLNGVKSVTHNGKTATIEFGTTGNDVLIIPSFAADYVFDTTTTRIDNVSSKYDYDANTLTISLLSNTSVLATTDYGTTTTLISGDNAKANTLNIELNSVADHQQKVDLSNSTAKSVTVKSSASANATDTTTIISGVGATTILSGGATGKHAVTVGTGGGFIDLTANGNATDATVTAVEGVTGALFIKTGAGAVGDSITVGDGFAKGVTVDAGNGSNNIKVGSGTGVVSIVGGSGNDNITVGGAAIVDAGQGTNNIVGGSGVVTVISSNSTNNGTDNITVGSGGGYINSANLSDTATLNLFTPEEGGPVTLVGGAGTHNVTLGTGGGRITLNGSDKEDNVVYNGGTATVVGKGVFDSASDKILVGTQISNAEIAKTAIVAGTGSDTNLQVTFKSSDSKNPNTLVIPIPSTTANMKLYQQNGTDIYAEVSPHFTYDATTDGTRIVKVNAGFASNSSSISGASGTGMVAIPTNTTVIDVTAVTNTPPTKVFTTGLGNDVTIKTGKGTYVTLASGEDAVKETILINSVAGSSVSVDGFDPENDAIQLPKGYSVSKTASVETGNGLEITFQSGNSQQTVTLTGAAAGGSASLTSVNIFDSTGEALTAHNGVSGYYEYNATSKLIKLMTNNAIPVNETITANDYPTSVTDINMTDVTSAICVIGNENANNITVDGGDGTTVYGGDGNDVFYFKATPNGALLADYDSGDKIVFLATPGENLTATSFSESDDSLLVTISNQVITISGVQGGSVQAYYKSGSSEIALTEISADFAYEYNSGNPKITLASDFEGTLGGSKGTAYPTATKVIDASSVTSGLVFNLEDATTDVTLASAAGKDTIYTSAKNGLIITNFEDGDVVQITAKGVSATKTAWFSSGSASDDGTDLVVDLSNNQKVTLTGARNANFSFLDSTGKAIPGVSGFFSYSGTNKSITINGDISGADIEKISSSTYPTSVTAIDMSKMTNTSENNAIIVEGNGQANTITTGSTGGVNYGTVSGGAGNDTLTYAGGIITISDYTASSGNSDTIKLGSERTSIYKTEYEGSDLVIRFDEAGENVLTILGAKGKKLNVVNSSGTTDSTTKAISGFFAYESVYTTGTGDEGGKIILNSAATSLETDTYPAADIVAIDASELGKAIKLEIGTSIKEVTGTNYGDTFVFTGGNGVVIKEFSAADTLQLKASGQSFQRTYFAADGAYDTPVTTASENGRNLIVYLSDGAETPAVSGYVVLEGLGEDGNFLEKVKVTNSSNQAIEGVSSYYSYEIDGTLVNDPDGNSRGTGKILTINPNYSGTIPSSAYPAAATDIAAGSNTEELNIVGNSKANWITGGKGKNTIAGGAANDTIIGYGSEDDASNEGDSLNGGAGNDYIKAAYGDNELIGDVGNDTLVGGAGNDILNGGAGNDSMFAGDGGENSLSGGDGNDTLYGATLSTAQTTMTGGNGSDVFVHQAGSDIITDYVVGQDKIKLYNSEANAGASVASSAVDGADVILNINNTNGESVGSVTVQGGKDKQLTVITENDDNSLTTETRIFGYFDMTTLDVSNEEFPGQVSLKANTTFEGTLGSTTYPSTVTIIDATQVEQAVTIQGNAKNNVIFGSDQTDVIYGNSGNNTIFAQGDDSYTTTQELHSEHAAVNGGEDTIIGGAGHEFIQGSRSDANRIDAAAGNDTINAQGGDNFILGGAGNDSIVAGDGANTIDAGNDNDYIEVGNGNNSIVAGAGNDTVTLGSGTNYVDGGNGNDSILAGSGDNTIIGGAGDDSLYGGTGNDYLDAGAGNDYIEGGAAGENTLTGGAGNDTFAHAAGADVVDIIKDYEAGKDKIKLLGTGTKVVSSSIDGKDVILNIGVDANTSYGSITVANGKDVTLEVVDVNGITIDKRVFGYFDYDSSTHTLTLNPGYEESTLKSTAYPSDVRTIDATAVTTTGGLYIQGNAQANTINGSGNDDTIYGGAANDSLNGGAGNDVLVGEAGDDTLNGGAGDNVMTGGAGSDVFVHDLSATANDVITDYTSGQDKINLSGGRVISSSINGSDVILNVADGDTEAGAVTITGGKDKTITVEETIDGAAIKTEGIFGYYSYDVDTSSKKATSITLNAEFAGTLNATMYASSVATIDATNVTDDVVIYGNSNANVITGSAKNESETIFAGDGADTIIATNANEVISGEAGNDIIQTGSGNDSISGGDGNDSIDAGNGDNTVLAGAGNDTILAGSGNDYLDGGDGNDYLEGGAGNDSLNGGAGNDTLVVSAGDNLLNGGLGNDSLVGGTGADTFTAGAGNDTIIFNGGDDIITDYKNVSGESDVIVIGDGSIESSEIDGDNVILNINGNTSGSVTIQNAKNSAVKVSVDGALQELIYGYYVYDSTDSANPSITLNSNFEGTLPASLYPANTKTIDATKVNTTSSEPLVVYGNSNANTILGSTIMANVLYGEAGADSIIGGNDGDTISGGAGNDYLEGGQGDDSLLGGAGSDTLDGGDNDDSLTGGDGVDTFIYSGGDDVITDYEASKDIIRYADGYALTGSAINGSDVTLTFSDGSHTGSLTVTKGKDKKIILGSMDATTAELGKGQIYGYYLGDENGGATLNSDFAGSAFTAKSFSTDITSIDATLLEDGINISITANDTASTVLGSNNNDSIYGGKDSDSLVGNSGDDFINGGAGADTLEGGEGNDRLLGDAGDDYLVGGNGTDTLTGGAGSDTFVYTGEDDIITDYEAGKDTIYLSETELVSSTISGSDVIFDMGGGSITVQKAKDKVITVADAENTISGIFGYFDGVGQETITVNSAFTGKELTAKMYSGATNNGEAVTVNAIDASQITTGIAIYANTAAATSIKSGEGNDSLIGASNDDTLYGGEGNNYIAGTAGSNYLYAGTDGSNTLVGASNADTLYTTDGTNTLTGGSGADIFLFNGGTNTITDYKSGEDVIQLAENVSVESSGLNGDDVILNMGAKGTVTVKDAKGKALTIVDANGDSDSRVYGYFDYADGAITLNADYPNDDVREAVYGSAVSTIYANAVEKGLAIYANSSDDVEGTYIVGSGNNDSLIGAALHNDTLIGGDGNDTLTGTSGNNYFVHTGGNDVISDYTYEDGRSDTILLSDSMIQSATVSGKDVIITTTGGGTVTVKNAKDKNILILNSGETEGTARIYGYYDYDDPTYIKLNEDFTGSFNASLSAPEALTVDGTAVSANITITSGHETDGTPIVIIGGEGSDKLVASDNGDTLTGYDGTDTLVGGAGADSFIYFMGQDVISNYTPGSDTIILSATSLTNSTVDGKDVVLNLANGGKITVKNAKNSELTVAIAGTDSVDTRIFGYYSYDSDDSTTIVVNSDFTETALTPSMYADTVTAIDATNLAKGKGITAYAGSTTTMTLLGGAGADKLYATTVTGADAAAYLDGGAGNDLLTGGAGADTLSGGTGNDTYSGGAGNDTFIYSGGNDVIKDYIYGEEQQDIIDISNGGKFLSSSVSGKDVLLNMSSNTTSTKVTGTITVKNAKNATLSVYDGTTTDTRIFGYYSYGESDTTIILNSNFAEKSFTSDLYAANVTVIDGSSVSGAYMMEGNEQDNTILGGAGANTIYGGAGADYIEGAKGNDALLGGEGDDTLIAGEGNDTLTGGDGADRFVFSAGNDVITDYDVTQSDTVKLNAGKIGSSSIKGSDIVLNLVNGKKSAGTITLKGQKNQQITIIDTDGVETTRLYGYYGYGESTDTIIVNSDFTGSLSAESVESGAYYSSEIVMVDGSSVKGGFYVNGNSNAQTLLGGKGNDTIVAGTGNSWLNSGDGNDSVVGGSGDDTLIGGKGNDTFYGGAGTNLFVATAGAEVIADYSVGTSNVISLASGKVTASTVKNGDVILTVGSKGTVTVKDAAFTELTVVDNTGASETRLYGYYTAKGAAITLNSDFRGTLTSDTTSTENAYYAESVTTISAATTNNAITILGNEADNHITAAKKASTIDGGAGADTIIGGAGADVLSGGDGADSVSGGAGADTISGGAGNDNLDGGAGNDSLNGGEGNDVLIAGAGNDTLTGGDGADVFVYSGGNDVIADYNLADGDYISLPSGSVSASTVSGGDVVLTVGSKGTITIKNAKNSDMTLANATSTVTGIFGYYTRTGADSIKLNVGFSGTLHSTTNESEAFYPENVATIDGSQVKNTLNIEGNAQDNRITAGKRNATIDGGAGNDTLVGNAGNDSLYGGDGNDLITGAAGNDTLWGGAGNDTLTGGAGKDIFNYSAGNDVITDYAAGQDRIIVDGTIETHTTVSSDIIFNIGGNTLTVKNGKGKSITISDSTGAYSMSNGNAPVSGSSGNAVDDLWFMEDDDNFTTGDTAELDSLGSLGDFTASVGDVETDYTNLTKEDAASKLVSSSK